MTIPQKSISEKQFRVQILDLAKLLGWECYCVFEKASWARRSSKGFPDLVAAKTGFPILFIELKRDGEKLTLDQEKWGRLLNRTSSPFLVWTPGMWNEIVKMLSGDYYRRRERATFKTAFADELQSD